MSINMTLQNGQFYNEGLWGNSLSFVGSSWNFVPVCIKNDYTPWKFQFEKTSNKKVIAKKPLTNLYEMNSCKLWPVISALLQEPTVHFIQVCQKAFWQWLSLLVSFFNETYMIFVNVLFMKSETKFQLDPTKDKDFPHRHPIVKIVHFCNIMSIDMTLQKWAILQLGSMGKFLIYCRIQLK